MERRRVALIGMNNPYSDNPRRALWPDPPNCTGWRVWKMLEARTGATQTDYLRAFHRYNLVLSGHWHSGDAARRWHQIQPELSQNFDTLVLLGKSVQRAAGVMCGDVLVTRGLVCIPHPSGLNRWYNSDVNRQTVEVILEELYTEAVLGYGS